MKKLRIALVNITKPHSGSGDGITEYTWQLYKKLQTKAQVDLIYSLESTKRNNIRGLVKTNIFFNIKIKKLASEGYDIIHITNHELGFAAKTLRMCGCSSKIVTTIHDLARFDMVYHKGQLQKAYNRMVASSIKDAIEYSDYLMFDGKQTYEDVVNKFGNIKKGYSIVNLGVKDSILNVRVKKHLSKFTIGYVGALVPHKNVMMLLKAAKELPEYTFLIYGTGIERENLKDYKMNNHLDNVEFLGFAPETKLPEIYDSFNLFAFPSRYEGFGLPILEAQARGIPVVIYKKGKITEEVKKYCFKASNEKDMVDIIKKQAMNKQTYPRTKMLRYARSFTWDRTARHTFDAYKKMIE